MLGSLLLVALGVALGVGLAIGALAVWIVCAARDLPETSPEDKE